MSQDEILELKAFVKAVIGGHVVTENMGYCKGCGEYKDLRMGYCFDCVFSECPLETCNYKRLKWTYIGKNEKKQILSDWKYIDHQTGKQYCNRTEGLCEEALAVLKAEESKDE